MRVLAVDTTSEFLDMSLAESGHCWNKRIKVTGKQDEKLYEGSRQLLKKAHWKYEDLDILAAAGGPGSFTGIRVGMTFVSMLAHILEKPAVAVSLLEAQAFIAFQAMKKNGAQELRPDSVIGAVLPARRDEFFFQTFHEKQGRLTILHEPQWVRPSDWPAIFRRDTGGRSVVLAGPYADMAAGLLPGPLRRKTSVLKSRAPVSSDLVPLALESRRNGSRSDFSPLYLKPAYYEKIR